MKGETTTDTIEESDFGELVLSKLLVDSAYQKGSEAIRLAHEAKTQKMIARQAEHNETLRRIVNRESVPGLPEGEGEGEEMRGDVMNIDSPTVNHFHGEPEEKKKKGLGTLAKMAIGLGLIGTGASIPLGVSAIVPVLKPDEKVERPAPVDNMKLKYLLDLGK